MVKYIFTTRQYLRGKVFQRNEIVPLDDQNKVDLVDLRIKLAQKMIRRIKIDDDGNIKELNNREQGEKDIEMKGILTGRIKGRKRRGRPKKEVE